MFSEISSIDILYENYQVFLSFIGKRDLRIRAFFQFFPNSRPFDSWNPEEDSNFTEMNFIEVPLLSELFQT
jgi:hypothetical protein